MEGRREADSCAVGEQADARVLVVAALQAQVRAQRDTCQLAHLLLSDAPVHPRPSELGTWPSSAYTGGR
jgi:hypothetical protein